MGPLPLRFAVGQTVEVLEGVVVQHRGDALSLQLQRHSEHVLLRGLQRQAHAERPNVPLPVFRGGKGGGILHGLGHLIVRNRGLALGLARQRPVNGAVHDLRVVGGPLLAEHGPACRGGHIHDLSFADRGCDDARLPFRRRQHAEALVGSDHVERSAIGNDLVREQPLEHLRACFGEGEVLHLQPRVECDGGDVPLGFVVRYRHAALGHVVVENLHALSVHALAFHAEADEHGAVLQQVRGQQLRPRQAVGLDAPGLKPLQRAALVVHVTQHGHLGRGHGCNSECHEQTEKRFSHGLFPH